MNALYKKRICSNCKKNVLAKGRKLSFGKEIAWFCSNCNYCDLVKSLDTTQKEDRSVNC